MHNDRIKPFELLRTKVEHEDRWIQQRMTWLLATTGFLFAGYGALLAFNRGQVGEEILRLRKWLLLILPFIGLGITCMVFAGLLAADYAIDIAQEEWRRLGGTEAERACLPSLRSTGRALSLGLLAHLGLCLFVAIAWMLVLVIVFVTVGLPH